MFRCLVIFFLPLFLLTLTVEAQEDPDVPGDLDIGKHQVIDSPFGPLSIGVSHLETVDDTGAATGRLEFGYTFTFETRDLIPKVIETTPFYIARFSASSADIDVSTGDGLGWRAGFGKKGSRFRWIAQASAIFPERRYVNSSSRETDLEFLLGFSIKLPSTSDDFATIERIRGLDSSQFEFSYEISAEEWRAASQEVNGWEILRLRMMSSYFLQWLNKKGLFTSAFAAEDFYYRLSMADFFEALGGPAERLEWHRLKQETTVAWPRLQALVRSTLTPAMNASLRDDLKFFLSMTKPGGGFCEYQVVPGTTLTAVPGSPSCLGAELGSDKLMRSLEDALSLATFLSLTQPAN
jgi:hypothetical protein